jgi:predicted AlkP superfamily phosphohydrolase/phosphomutase
MENPKAVLIGLDGADWRLLKPWMAEGLLPTLYRLVSEGVSGKLRSTIRPESSVAWSSLSTGVNPGKHGIFGFAESVPSSYNFRLINASNVNVRRFWDALGDAGLKIGVLNMPVTYPPSSVNGFVIGGMLTPGLDTNFTYPASLRSRLLRHFPDYLIDAGDLVSDRQALVDKAHRYTEQQLAMTLWLMQEEPCDFFSVVFTAPDRIQHFLWADMDREHPAHLKQPTSTLSNAILQLYKQLDQAIAQILSQLSENTLVIIVSDHGFNGVQRRFYVNEWLTQHGYIRLKPEITRWRSDLVGWVKRNIGTWQWLRRIKRAILSPRLSLTDLESHAFEKAVDWSRTRAYFSLVGGLHINLEGRDPQGIVSFSDYPLLCEELVEQLMALVDPETQRPILTNVYHRTELYAGPYVAKSPDLILEPQRENDEARYNVVLDKALHSESGDYMGLADPLSANHTMDGIFIAWGNGLVRGATLDHIQLIDIAPTLLAHFRIPVPGYMDGRVLDEIYVPGTAPSFTIDADAVTIGLVNQSADYSAKESVAVETRLRDLGYLD